MASIPAPQPDENTPRQVLNWGQSISAFLRYSLLILLSIFFLFPFYIMLKNGLMTDTAITGGWTWWPDRLHFENIPELFNDDSVSYATGLLNSTIIAVLQTLGQLVFASLAGYGLARFRYRWSNLVFYLILGTMLIPSAVTFVPTYLVVNYLGWVSTLQGLIVPGLFSAFSVFLFRQFFLNFPRELEDAGRVDGLNYVSVFWYIVIPNSRPIFIALGAISFIGSWNAFLWPLVVGQDQSAYTLQVVLSTFLTSQTMNLHELFLAATIGILPLVVVFFLLQRYLVEGVKQSGLKG